MYLGHQLNFLIFVIIKREKVFIKKREREREREKKERKSKRLNPMIMKELNFKKIERLWGCLVSYFKKPFSVFKHMYQTDPYLVVRTEKVIGKD